MGLQSVYFFSSLEGQNKSDPQESREKSKISPKILALLSVLFLVAACLLPSGVPALFNGLPINTHIEYIFLAIFIPLSLILHWRSFARPWLVITTLSIFLLKLILVLSAPAYGIVVDAYKTESDMASRIVMRSYESLVVAPHTLVMHEPFNNFREFPFEWYNETFVTPPSNNWIGLHLATYGYLPEGDKLVFFVIDLTASHIQMTYLDSGQPYPFIFLNEDNTLDIKAIQNTPMPLRFNLTGDLTFSGERIHQLKPMLLKADGSLVDPFSEGIFWTSANGVQLALFCWVFIYWDMLFMPLPIPGSSNSWIFIWVFPQWFYLHSPGSFRMQTSASGYNGSFLPSWL